MHIDWQKLFGAMPNASLSPKFSEVFVAPAQERSEREAD
jgi:hypothetical protein